PFGPEVRKGACRAIVRTSGPETLAFQPEPFDQLVDAPKLVWLVGQRAAGFYGGAPRLILVAQHHIGTNQPQPSLVVGPILLGPRGGPRHQGAPLLALWVSGALAGRGYVLGGGPRRRRMRIDAGQRFTHQADPASVRRCTGEQVPPDLCGLLGAPVL